VLLLTQRYNEADQEIEERIETPAEFCFRAFLQGSMYSHTSRPELARGVCGQRFSMIQRCRRRLLQLVNLYLQQKRPSEAISELQSYVKAFPDTPFAPQARDLLKRLQGNESSSPQ